MENCHCRLESRVLLLRSSFSVWSSFSSYHHAAASLFIARLKRPIKWALTFSTLVVIDYILNGLPVMRCMAVARELLVEKSMLLFSMLMIA